jgi:hypothetical protein
MIDAQGAIASTAPKASTMGDAPAASSASTPTTTTASIATAARTAPRRHRAPRAGFGPEGTGSGPGGDGGRLALGDVGVTCSGEQRVHDLGEHLGMAIHVRFGGRR